MKLRKLKMIAIIFYFHDFVLPFLQFYIFFWCCLSPHSGRIHPRYCKMLLSSEKNPLCHYRRIFRLWILISKIFVANKQKKTQRSRFSDKSKVADVIERWRSARWNFLKWRKMICWNVRYFVKNAWFVAIFKNFWHVFLHFL